MNTWLKVVQWINDSSWKCSPGTFDTHTSAETMPWKHQECLTAIVTYQYFSHITEAFLGYEN